MPSNETSPAPARPPRLRRVQVTSLVLLALIGAISSMARAMLAIPNPLIRGEPGLPLSSFLSACTPTQLPAGPIMHCSGPRHSEYPAPQLLYST